MKITDFTLKLIPDERYKDYKGDKKTRKYPIRLRITTDCKQYFFSTGVTRTLAEWKKELSNRSQEIAEYEAKTKQAMEKLKAPFEREKFEKEMDGIDSVGETLEDCINNYIIELRKDNSYKHARTWENAKVSFEKFRPGMLLKEVDETILAEYTRWMIQTEKNSKTTISIYVRCIRKLWNDAIAARKLKSDDYPFMKGRYEIPKGKSKKITITMEELSALADYETTNLREQEARDMFMFSYYCAGSNPTDICRLTWKSIDKTENTITFETRKKTEETDEEQEPLIIPLDEDINAIINKWGNINQVDSEDYIFKVLKKGMKEEEIVPLIEAYNRKLNSGLAGIHEQLKFKNKPTMGVARCSFANNLQDSNVPKSKISKLMRHKNETTTDIYLKKLKNNVFAAEMNIIKPQRKNKLKVV